MNFYDGQFIASQFVGTIDASRGFDVGMASPLTVALGAEAREDTYRIDAGDPSSYYKEGPQSFPGFAPGQRHQPKPQELRGLYGLCSCADRAVADRYRGPRRAFHRLRRHPDRQGHGALRLHARNSRSAAPSRPVSARRPWRRNIYTAVNVSPTSATVQLPANSAAAKILGLPNLKPEISTQYSLGIVAHPFDDLSTTVDVYSLTLGNRIVASSTVTSSGGAINTPLVTQAVLADGVSLDPTATQQGVTAFLNGINTLTQGVDVVVTYLSDFDAYGLVRWTLAGNYNNTVVRVAPAPAMLLASNPSASFFNQQSLYQLRPFRAPEKSA